MTESPIVRNALFSSLFLLTACAGGPEAPEPELETFSLKWRTTTGRVVGRDALAPCGAAIVPGQVRVLDLADFDGDRSSLEEAVGADQQFLTNQPIYFVLPSDELPPSSRTKAAIVELVAAMGCNVAVFEGVERLGRRITDFNCPDGMGKGCGVVQSHLRVRWGTKWPGNGFAFFGTLPPDGADVQRLATVAACGDAVSPSQVAVTTADDRSDAAAGLLVQEEWVLLEEDGDTIPPAFRKSLRAQVAGWGCDWLEFGGVVQVRRDSPTVKWYTDGAVYTRGDASYRQVRWGMKSG